MKNNYQKLSVLISICLLTLISCQKEILEDYEYLPNEISSARAWFEANYSTGIVFSKQTPENKSYGVPYWDHAIISWHKEFNIKRKA